MSIESIDIIPFDELLGVASNNVPAYSNSNDLYFSVERNFIHGIFTGIKWQCVEYARRWLLLKKSCVFKNVSCAADIWTDVSYVERITDGKKFSLKLHENGSLTPPTNDSFLIYSRCESQPVGHIAIICGISMDYIHIAEQNNKFHAWKHDYARELSVKFIDNRYYIIDDDHIHGWMEIENDDQLQPFDQLNVDQILSEYQQAQSIGSLKRCTTIATQNQLTTNHWLDINDNVENFYNRIYQNYLQRNIIQLNSLPYYEINQDFMFTIAGFTKELNKMFLVATEYVINNDHLLTRLGIDQIFWKRIRNSWKNEQHLAMIGQLVMEFIDEHFQLLAYKSDSLNGIFDFSVIQKKWSKAVQLPSQFMSAFCLHSTLVNRCKRINMTNFVHILIKENDDDRLTAYYIQKVLKEAGINSKLCIDTEKFIWINSQFVDSDNIQVELIWKLLPWSEIIENYTEKHIELLNGNRNFINGEVLSIKELLICDQIQVIEPFWKIVPSQKEMLSILLNLYPNHQCLRKNEIHLQDQMTKIYSWIIFDHFSGFGIREEKQSRIDEISSIITPCCIVWDN